MARVVPLAPALGVDRLIALCARAETTAPLSRLVREECARYVAWDDFVATVEGHGIGPLAERQLREARAEAPRAIRADLVGLKHRHARAGAVRARELVRITAALEARGIGSLVLKGGALAHLVYSAPGERPLRDLDILIHPADIPASGEVLRSLGYPPADGMTERQWASYKPDFHDSPTRPRVPREPRGVAT